MLLLSLAIQSFFLIFPWPIRRFLLNRLLGFHIDPSARVGLSILSCDRVYLDRSSRIGHLTVVKGLEELRLHPFARVGNLNWITGQVRSGRHFLEQTARRSILTVGTHAAITHRHLIDCTDVVTIGAFSTVAGWGSQILTHGIDVVESRQRCAPVSVGDYCFVGTRSILLKGSVLPQSSVLAPGAVLSRAFDQSHTLYGGVPARAIKEIAAEAAYFHRAEGFVV